MSLFRRDKILSLYFPKPPTIQLFLLQSFFFSTPSPFSTQKSTRTWDTGEIQGDAQLFSILIRLYSR
ncbi:uncharacterized protein IAS62_003208 [Cryptococcus decagattii]|uniref:Uncharacterized protein n=1 Tax=Cryptococcus decagattii TaxID=1859122 RepID=A0ABZ2AXE0_9TREE